MFEVLRTVAIGKRNANDPHTSAERLANAAKRDGALAMDIYEDNEGVYIDMIWPTEKRWLMFKSKQKLKKKVGRDLWTKRG